VSQELRVRIESGNAITSREQAFALRVVASSALRLTPQDARAIFECCLSALRSPANPYDPGTTFVVATAREAAAAILAIDSSLDERMCEALKDPAASAMAASLAASALKERPERASTRFAAYAEAMALSPERLVRFAEDCDVPGGVEQFVSTRRARAMERLVSHFRFYLQGRAPLLLAALLPICVTIVLALVCQHAGGGVISAGISPPVAIGALAVLAAVHILSVQLAAQRLPGPIASAAVLPSLAAGSYVTGFLMLLVALVGQEKPVPSWHPSLVAAGLLLLFVILVFAMTINSLRTTSAASASEAVCRRRRRQARRAGRRFAELQRRAVRIQELADKGDYLRVFPSPQEAARRYAIRARASGFVQINARLLVEGQSRGRWPAEEARLDIVVLPGLPVAAGREIASVVPVGDATLAKEAIRTAERAISVRDEREIDRFAELCAALCSEVPMLVRAGDIGGAHRVVAALSGLLGEHMRRLASKQGSFVGALPVSPAVMQTVEQAASALARAASERERVTVALVIDACLDLCSREDGVVALVAKQLAREATTLGELGVLYRAGCRAAALESTGDLRIVQDALHRLARGSEESARYANECAGRLVLYCAEVAPQVSRAAWTRWWSSTGATPEGDRVRIASRVGAGGLPIGNLSLCVEVALALREQDFEALKEQIRKPGEAAFEGLLSQLYGRLLGSDAEQRIVDFLDFAVRVKRSVAQSSGVSS
jgi:hypothetical protein